MGVATLLPKYPFSGESNRKNPYGKPGGRRGGCCHFYEVVKNAPACEKAFEWFSEVRRVYRGFALWPGAVSGLCGFWISSCWGGGKDFFSGD